MKYRKKPIVIEAYQTQVSLEIETLEGIMQANVGDWIITGVNGEKYPCKPDIFEKTYELADAETEFAEKEIKGFEDFHPRAVKLLRKRKNFLVIATLVLERVRNE